jgi:hypothetical protein
VTALKKADKSPRSSAIVGQLRQQGVEMAVPRIPSPSLDPRGERKGLSVTTAEASDIWREIARRLELEPRRGNIRGTAAPTLGAANREATAWPSGGKTRPIIPL